MTWVTAIRKRLLIAALLGVVATALYDRLFWTSIHWHGFAVKALGPARDLVCHYFENQCYQSPYVYLEELGANAVIYTFWISVVLISLHLGNRLARYVAAVGSK